jgi:DNA-binding PadR family transcriptional regulator
LHFSHERRPHGARHHHDGGHRRLRGFFSHGRGGRSVRRGNVRAAILAVLRDQPMHGYQVIQELENRTSGRWRPSAGSVYPTLQMLEDEGLITSQEVEGRKTYTLTEAGRTTVEESESSGQPWLEADDGAAEAADLRRVAMGLLDAAIQVKRIGSPEANIAAREILLDSRRKLYALLAEVDIAPDA